MKNIKTVRGVLQYSHRKPTSTNGNPRHSVFINGTLYSTEVDAPLGYTIPEFDGKAVKAIVGIHYGIDTIIRVEEM